MACLYYAYSYMVEISEWRTYLQIKDLSSLFFFSNILTILGQYQERIHYRILNRSICRTSHWFPRPYCPVNFVLLHSIFHCSFIDYYRLSRLMSNLNPVVWIECSISFGKRHWFSDNVLVIWSNNILLDRNRLNKYW